MNLILSLVLGHLIGDFPLQTGRLVQWKINSVWGIATHSAIVTSSMIIFSWGFGSGALGYAVLLGLLHWLIDSIKIYWGKSHGDEQPVVFLLDQAVHVALIVVIVRWGLFPWSNGYFNQEQLWIAIWYVVVSFTGAILIQIMARAIVPQSNPGGFVTISERWGEMAARVLLTTGLWQGWIIWSLCGIALNLLFFPLGWRQWMHPLHWGVRVGLNLILSVVIGIALKFTI